MYDTTKLLQSTWGTTSSALYDCNGYFASSIRIHNDHRHVISAAIYSATSSNYSNYNFEFYVQKPLSTMYASSFNDTSNMQYTYVCPYSSAVNS